MIGGTAVYTNLVLSVYDRFVLGFSNSLAWKCPSPLLVDFYNQNVSGNHLDVGVGTGYFLDKCKFPASNPSITLVDLNPNSLKFTGQRLRRYRPKAYIADALELRLETTFDSIALNYLLHCLPGNIRSKGAVLENLTQMLNEGGVMFGSTILGKGVKHNLLAKCLMRCYNSTGIFDNTNDSAEDLEAVLKAHFQHYALQIIGCVAVFTGRKPGRGWSKIRPPFLPLNSDRLV